MPSSDGLLGVELKCTAFFQEMLIMINGDLEATEQMTWIG